MPVGREKHYASGLWGHEPRDKQISSLRRASVEMTFFFKKTKKLKVIAGGKDQFE